MDLGRSFAAYVIAKLFFKVRILSVRNRLLEYLNIPQVARYFLKIHSRARRLYPLAWSKIALKLDEFNLDYYRCSEKICVKTENLHSKLHDSIDNIRIVVLKGFNGLSSGASGLTDNQLDVLGIKTSL